MQKKIILSFIQGISKGRLQTFHTGLSYHGKKKDLHWKLCSKSATA